VAKVEKDYEELLELFNRHKVKYCIVGAFALGFHALPRYTKDMDIFVEASPENAEKILSALKEFGLEGLAIKKKDFSKPGKTIQLGYEPVRVDLLTSIDGCKFSSVWQNRKNGKYGKQTVSFIGANDLIKNKKATNRKQDQVDLEILKKGKKR